MGSWGYYRDKTNYNAKIEIAKTGWEQKKNTLLINSFKHGLLGNFILSI